LFKFLLTTQTYSPGEAINNWILRVHLAGLQFLQLSFIITSNWLPGLFHRIHPSTLANLLM